jgi:hypothetical protein
MNPNGGEKALALGLQELSCRRTPDGLGKERTGGRGVLEGRGVTYFSVDRSLGVVAWKNPSADEVQKSAEHADGRRVVKNWK